MFSAQTVVWRSPWTFILLRWVAQDAQAPAGETLGLLSHDFPVESTNLWEQIAGRLDCGASLWVQGWKEGRWRDGEGRRLGLMLQPWVESIGDWMRIWFNCSQISINFRDHPPIFLPALARSVLSICWRTKPERGFHLGSPNFNSSTGHFHHVCSPKVCRT